jgi:hypothetical protein
VQCNMFANHCVVRVLSGGQTRIRLNCLHRPERAHNSAHRAMASAWPKAVVPHMARTEPPAGTCKPKHAIEKGAATNAACGPQRLVGLEPAG